MKTVNTNKGEFLFVEIPIDAYDFNLYHLVSGPLENPSTRFLYFVEWKQKSAPLSIMAKQQLGYDEYEIVATTENITKKQAATIVESIEVPEKGSFYKAYRDKHITPFFINSINSFKTLLQFEELNAPRYIILKKKVKTEVAPYLTIAGAKVLKGSEYFIVNHNGDITFHKASNENNTVHNCYFLTRREAEIYARLIKLSKPIYAAIKEIEENHLGR